MYNTLTVLAGSVDPEGTSFLGLELANSMDGSDDLLDPLVDGELETNPPPLA